MKKNELSHIHQLKLGSATSQLCVPGSVHKDVHHSTVCNGDELEKTQCLVRNWVSKMSKRMN